MLQEVKDLQNGAVEQLVKKANEEIKEITFRAPTGSGKTYMMADFMNRMLANNPNIIFLVSSLSKGGLAKQNYEKFLEYNSKGMFNCLQPYLITSEISGEEDLFIPIDYNVYVLPRDLYKESSRLNAGSLLKFLQTMTSGLGGKNKQIYVIKDECHVATKNLDGLSNRYFTKVINFSATPKLSRGQYPDVEITDEEAVNAKLIKHVEMGAEEDTVEMAINKFEQIKGNYRNLIGVNPCLIIQISNKDKAEEEWKKILSVLNKTKHQDLKWMVIVDKTTSLCDTNDIVKKTLSIDKWKDYAKSNLSTIDIIVFKMVISEGWDIPRACMLYQVRDTQSKQLDEQVMGRVRRNPRLLDFETLSDKAKQLATTAWVWGIAPESIKRIRPVKLVGGKDEVKNALQIKTIRIKPLTKHKNFDIEEFLNEQKPINPNESLFTLQRKLASCDNEIQEMCYSYADTISEWFSFTKHLDGIKKAYNNYVCNYDESMETDKNDDGTEKIVSFPLTSSFMENGSNNYNKKIGTWVWRRKDNNKTFSFDSEAEKKWAEVLFNLSNNGKIKDFNLNTSQGQSLLQEDENKKYLWGKNFLFNSEIRFQYYHNGIHSSYPDFIMKDKEDRIHIFEVKSVNKSNNMNFDEKEYNDKITALKKCYKRCSQLLPYNFYLPMYKDSEWQITRYSGGNEAIISEKDFITNIS